MAAKEKGPTGAGHDEPPARASAQAQAQAQAEDRGHREPKQGGSGNLGKLDAQRQAKPKEKVEGPMAGNHVRCPPVGNEGMGRTWEGTGWTIILISGFLVDGTWNWTWRTRQADDAVDRWPKERGKIKGEG